jgi:P27 family predicted phage terminase small subunit
VPCNGGPYPVGGLLKARRETAVGVGDGGFHGSIEVKTQIPATEDHPETADSPPALGIVPTNLKEKHPMTAAGQARSGPKPGSEEAYRPPRAPKSLQAAGRALWKRICAEWELESDAEELALLAHACHAEDLCTAAQEALDEHGLTFEDRFGTPKERPELRILRQQRAAVASLLKQITQSQTSWERLELARDREDRVRAQADRPRDRRGGGFRYG